MTVFCLDIGNTALKYGLVVDGRVIHSDCMPTSLLDEPEKGIAPILKKYATQSPSPDGLSFCSVVPAVTKKFKALLEPIGWPQFLFNLTWKNCPLPINFPDSREIGQDILANAVAAEILYGAPVIVIDMGTAVTFDIISRHGYEGGIIAPGLGLMTQYLHEQTALLPKLDPNNLIVSAGIGKTTVEAMKLGCTVGFAGMIRALLERVQEELKERGEGPATVVATGGSAGMLPQSWLADITFHPDITLLGLAHAFALTRK